jgi:asparagine synthase (glutamine-hydrolysing)
MCGIAGIFHVESSKPVDPERVKRMTDAIAHRGPDGSGVWTAPGIGLGHRRLSIIDLGGGAQPMFSEDESIALIFNGEVYNFMELRKELELLGHAFRTNSDSEVIIEAYRRWGPDSVARLQGMFAFALYDQPKRQLLLARGEAFIPCFAVRWQHHFRVRVKGFACPPGAAPRTRSGGCR